MSEMNVSNFQRMETDTALDIQPRKPVPPHLRRGIKIAAFVATILLLVFAIKAIVHMKEESVGAKVERRIEHKSLASSLSFLALGDWGRLGNKAQAHDFLGIVHHRFFVFQNPQPPTLQMSVA